VTTLTKAGKKEPAKKKLTPFAGKRQVTGVSGKSVGASPRDTQYRWRDTRKQKRNPIGYEKSLTRTGNIQRMGWYVQSGRENLGKKMRAKTPKKQKGEEKRKRYLTFQSRGSRR